MVRSLLLSCIIFISSFSFAQQKSDSALFETLRQADSLLFDVGFNHCDSVAVRRLMHPQLEFLHDQGGIQNLEEFFTAYRNNICGNASGKPIRKLREGSLEVFPMYQNGVLYGAVQNGTHSFYLKAPGETPEHTSDAKFSHTWLLVNGNWQLYRVLSYDHASKTLNDPFAKSTMEAAISRLENARDYTLAVAEKMPEAQFGFKPVPEEMNFGSQLLHIAQNLGWLSSSYFGNGQNPISKQDMQASGKTAIIAVVRRSYDSALAVLQAFDPYRLNQTVSFFAGPMKRIRILNLINDHQTHHRGQLLVYLRLKGIAPPRYVGW